MANKRHRRTKKRVRESRKEMEGGLFGNSLRSKINSEANGKYYFRSDEDSNVKIQEARQAKIEKVRSIHSKSQLTGVVIMICSHIYDTYIAERSRMTEHDTMYFSNDLANFIKQIMTILNGYHELLNDVFYTDGEFPVFDKEMLRKFVINPYSKKGYVYGETQKEDNTGLPYTAIEERKNQIDEQLAKIEKFNVFFKCYKETPVDGPVKSVDLVPFMDIKDPPLDDRESNSDKVNTDEIKIEGVNNDAETLDIDNEDMNQAPSKPMQKLIDHIKTFIKTAGSSDQPTENQAPVSSQTSMNLLNIDNSNMPRQLVHPYLPITESFFNEFQIIKNHIMFFSVLLDKLVQAYKNPANLDDKKQYKIAPDPTKQTSEQNIKTLDPKYLQEIIYISDKMKIASKSYQTAARLATSTYESIKTGMSLLNTAASATSSGVSNFWNKNVTKRGGKHKKHLKRRKQTRKRRVKSGAGIFSTFKSELYKNYGYKTNMISTPYPTFIKNLSNALHKKYMFILFFEEILKLFMENTFRYGIDLTKNDSQLADQDDNYEDEVKETLKEYQKEVEQKIEEFKDIAIIYKKIAEKDLIIDMDTILVKQDNQNDPNTQLIKDLTKYNDKIQKCIDNINEMKSEERNKLTNIYRDYERRSDIKEFVDYVMKLKDQNTQQGGVVDIGTAVSLSSSTKLSQYARHIGTNIYHFGKPYLVVKMEQLKGEVESKIAKAEKGLRRDENLRKILVYETVIAKIKYIIDSKVEHPFLRTRLFNEMRKKDPNKPIKDLNQLVDDTVTKTVTEAIFEIKKDATDDIDKSLNIIFANINTEYLKSVLNPSYGNRSENITYMFNTNLGKIVESILTQSNDQRIKYIIDVLLKYNKYFHVKAKYNHLQTMSPQMNNDANKYLYDFLNEENRQKANYVFYKNLRKLIDKPAGMLSATLNSDKSIVGLVNKYTDVKIAGFKDEFNVYLENKDNLRDAEMDAVVDEMEPYIETYDKTSNPSNGLLNVLINNTTPTFDKEVDAMTQELWGEEIKTYMINTLKEAKYDDIKSSSDNNDVKLQVLQAESAKYEKMVSVYESRANYNVNLSERVIAFKNNMSNYSFMSTPLFTLINSHIDNIMKTEKTTINGIDKFNEIDIYQSLDNDTFEVAFSNPKTYNGIKSYADNPYKFDRKAYTDIYNAYTNIGIIKSDTQFINYRHSMEFMRFFLIGEYDEIKFNFSPDTKFESKHAFNTGIPYKSLLFNKAKLRMLNTALKVCYSLLDAEKKKNLKPDDIKNALQITAETNDIVMKQIALAISNTESSVSGDQIQTNENSLVNKNNNSGANSSPANVQPAKGSNAAKVQPAAKVLSAEEIKRKILGNVDKVIKENADLFQKIKGAQEKLTSILSDDTTLQTNSTLKSELYESFYKELTQYVNDAFRIQLMIETNIDHMNRNTNLAKQIAEAYVDRGADFLKIVAIPFIPFYALGKSIEFSRKTPEDKIKYYETNQIILERVIDLYKANVLIEDIHWEADREGLSRKIAYYESKNKDESKIFGIEDSRHQYTRFMAYKAINAYEGISQKNFIQLNQDDKENANLIYFTNEQKSTIQKEIDDTKKAIADKYVVSFMKSFFQNSNENSFIKLTSDIMNKMTSLKKMSSSTSLNELIIEQSVLKEKGSMKQNFVNLKNAIGTGVNYAVVKPVSEVSRGVSTMASSVGSWFTRKQQQSTKGGKPSKSSKKRTQKNRKSISGGADSFKNVLLDIFYNEIFNEKAKEIKTMDEYIQFADRCYREKLRLGQLYDDCINRLIRVTPAIIERHIYNRVKQIVLEEPPKINNKDGNPIVFPSVPDSKKEALKIKLTKIENYYKEKYKTTLHDDYRMTLKIKESAWRVGARILYKGSKRFAKMIYRQLSTSLNFIKRNGITGLLITGLTAISWYVMFLEFGAPGMGVTASWAIAFIRNVILVIAAPFIEMPEMIIVRKEQILATCKSLTPSRNIFSSNKERRYDFLTDIIVNASDTLEYVNNKMNFGIKLKYNLEDVDVNDLITHPIKQTVLTSIDMKLITFESVDIKKSKMRRIRKIKNKVKDETDEESTARVNAEITKIVGKQDIAMLEKNIQRYMVEFGLFSKDVAGSLTLALLAGQYQILLEKLFNNLIGVISGKNKQNAERLLEEMGKKNPQVNTENNTTDTTNEVATPPPGMMNP